MSDLAILGGPKAVPKPLLPYSTIGDEERQAVNRVMASGRLSGFVGAWCDDFFGGPEVREFEAAWARRFGVMHAVSVNSNTSGLFASIGAVGVSPGDEVIVPPYTMSATAMAPLIYGGIPVFVDIEPDTFCLDPDKVRAAITSRTRAILAVNLLGHPAALHDLRKLADDHGIFLIEDNAQAPLATERGRYTGTIGHIGVFSLNYHKHFHTGEGGICTTDDPRLAQRLQMIRNHGENIVEPLGMTDISNVVGFNYRLTELSAAVGIEQLKKADRLVTRREELGSRLSAELGDLPGLQPPVVRNGCRHVYYVWAMRFDEARVGVSRATFCKALAAEGFPVSEGYVAPLYLLPMFQRRIAFGARGYPFTLSEIAYPRGLCPVTERMHDKELLEFHICSYEVMDEDLSLLAAAVRKVYQGRSKLQGWTGA